MLSLYNFSFQLSKVKLFPNTYFAISFQRLPKSFFVSKKVFQKINIIAQDTFLHYPLFILSFQSKAEFLQYFKNLIDDVINLEYINLDFLIFSEYRKLVSLFDTDLILKSFNNFFKLYSLFINFKVLKL